MPKYRNKKVVEARKVTGLPQDMHSIADWCDGNVIMNDPPHIIVSSFSWEEVAEVGDYVVTDGVDFWVVYEHDFEQHYERVDE